MNRQYKTNVLAESEHKTEIGNPKKQPRARRRTFYLIQYKPHARPHGMKLLNKADVFANGPPITFAPPDLNIRGFRSYPVTPRFHLSRRFGRIPADIEKHGSYWLVSDRAKRVLSEISPANFAFMALDTEVDPDQSAVSYWLCDIITMTDAIDFENSRLSVKKDDRNEDFIEITQTMKIVFKECLIDDSHVFRLLGNSFAIVCDDIFKVALKTAGITGLMFNDLTLR